MIEKLKWDEQPEDAAKEVQNLIDQLVDAVNVLQAQVAILQEHAHPTAKTESTETPTISKIENVSFGTGRRIDISYIDDVDNDIDTYAEQRKWIGCLVEYGNADDGFRYGILTNIEPRYSAYPFEIDNGRDATADCWLPSKTIFYKGGDNE